MKYSKEEIAEARAAALRWVKPGTTVYTKLNHVSRSGMSRSITPIVMIDNEPRYIAWSTAILFGQSRDKYDGIRVDGCGMDMGFYLVYSLSRILFRDGFGDEMTRTSANGRTLRKTPKTKAEATSLYELGYRANGRNGNDTGWDPDGGYALEHRWL